MEEGKTQELFPYHVNGRECLHVHCLVNSLSQTIKVLSARQNVSLSVDEQDACVLVEGTKERLGKDEKGHYQLSCSGLQMGRTLNGWKVMGKGKKAQRIN